MDSTADAVDRYFDAIRRRDLDGMVATWAPGSTDTMAGMADLEVPGDLRKWFGALFEAVPDFEMTVVKRISEGDTATVLWKATGTFDGEGSLEGFKPNGVPIEMEGLDMLTVRDGLIVGNRAFTNPMSLARQIGAMPAAGSAGEKAMQAAFNAKTALRQRLSRGRS